jgi:DHA1 family bicyclomycin/chloramphenicol resistance-like MFS transporter
MDSHIARAVPKPTPVSPALLVTLALLAAIAPMATDLYLPAFPLMVEELSITSTQVQLSLTAFLVGGGAGQALFGPLSDRFGRRQPLLIGLTLYVAASIAAASAPSITALLMARLVQGFASAAGMVIGRAVVADVAHGAEAARVFNVVMLAAGVAPIAAPVLGSTLAHLIGWRGLMLVSMAVGLVTIPAVYLSIRDTRPSAHSGPMAGRGGLRTALKSRDFIGYSLASSFMLAVLMAYISASPFLYQTMMGLSSFQYGLVFGVNALLLMGTGLVSNRLSRRFPVESLARNGLRISLAAIALLALLAASGAPAVALALPLSLAIGVLGLAAGNITALALDAARGAAGSASALMGMLQFGVAGIAAPLVNLGGTSTTLPMTLVMLCFSCLTYAAFSYGTGQSSRRAHP